MAKDKIINFKIEGEAKEAFEKICEDEFKTISQDLYTYVHRRIKQSKGSRISLSELNKKR